MSAGTPGQAAPKLWKPGDRVEVHLPDKNGVKGRRRSRAWFSGTVRVSDPTGVIVDLDIPVNGVPDCYATQGELRAAGAGE